MSVRVRIAPSPTGNLHIGTARTAVFNWLFARHLGGQFILRIEDTDRERSRPEYTDNILAGLNWLGLTWDEGPFYQSQRLDLYKQAVQTLLDQGLAYRCYCTPEELDDMRAKQKAAGLAPRYDNRHRNLTADEQAAFEAEGRKPVIRFRIDDDRTIVWKDLVRGTVSWKASDLGGDMVVARAAEAGGVGQPLYNLAVVVDDMDMTITHVIRGEDHIANTAKQILLYEAFGGQVPEFAHTPLILNQDGRKLSKRDGVTSISDFRQMGYIAPALANYMTLLGWTAPDATQEIFTLDEAAQTFTFDRVNQAGAKFDWDKLNWINSQYLHHLPIPELTDLILPVWQEAGFATDSEERSWLEQIVALIGPSLTRLPEAVELAQMFFSQEINFSEEATEQLQKEGVKEILESLLATVEGQSATEDTLKDAIKAVTKEKKVKKGLVMRSLRAALTGEVHGPDLIQSWLLWNQKGQDSDRIKQSLKTLASSV
ncbi:MAG: glutamate--tRNA ligase [Roseofilum sp. Belize BBD 4]|uniref:glutamate--tRNA ligase n=1 Tax=Roseofilum sp. Belize BBD 4 TaxID=2821500 RepID=UPI001B22A43C|nr:glutamate--tRNA ligase [Roseofilum sp. Belize BBD 4]MBP0032586.1 glutamate--tRNA ligase [Roseofilum sp. Belize BBD 4]